MVRKSLTSVCFLDISDTSTMFVQLCGQIINHWVKAEWSGGAWGTINKCRILIENIQSYFDNASALNSLRAPLLCMVCFLP
jgi:hypothetical protein